MPGIGAWSDLFMGWPLPSRALRSISQHAEGAPVVYDGDNRVVMVLRELEFIKAWVLLCVAGSEIALKFC